MGTSKTSSGWAGRLIEAGGLARLVGLCNFFIIGGLSHCRWRCNLRGKKYKVVTTLKHFYDHYNMNVQNLSREIAEIAIMMKTCTHFHPSKYKPNGSSTSNCLNSDKNGMPGLMRVGFKKNI